MTVINMSDDDLGGDYVEVEREFVKINPRLFMTWKEFKENIDAQLKEKGIDENTKIWYIDISFPKSVEAYLDDIGISIQ